MHLKNISLINFKNYSEAALEFSEDVNCFVGNNGVGKTNLLDAIHYLCFTKSYFNSIDYQNIKSGTEFFIAQGEFSEINEKRYDTKDVDENNEVNTELPTNNYQLERSRNPAQAGLTTTIYCSVSQTKGKIFKKNKKEYPRISEHIGLFPCVMISPEDVNLINEGARTRRKFIDSIISQYDKNYLDSLIRYNKALEQRDTLLKHFAESGKFDFSSLEIWDKQLIDFGKIIYKSRKKFLSEFIQIFQKYFQIVSNDAETVSLEYESQLNGVEFEKLLNESLMSDRSAQRTTSGIHKDDLIFKVYQNPIKTFGSQGQQKSYLIALKLAQFEYIKEIKKYSPILLLDDIFDKLDNSRIHALMQLVSSHHFGQIFITDTDENRIKTIFNKINVDLKLFYINANQQIEANETNC